MDSSAPICECEYIKICMLYDFIDLLCTVYQFFVLLIFVYIWSIELFIYIIYGNCMSIVVGNSHNFFWIRKIADKW